MLKFLVVLQFRDLFERPGAVVTFEILGNMNNNVFGQLCWWFKQSWALFKNNCRSQFILFLVILEVSYRFESLPTYWPRVILCLLLCLSNNSRDGKDPLHLLQLRFLFIWVFMWYSNVDFLINCCWQILHWWGLTPRCHFMWLFKLPDSAKSLPHSD